VAPDGGTAISASYDKTLKIWHIESGEELETLKGHTSWVRSVAVTPDGKIISGSYDGTMRVWSKNQEVHKFQHDTLVLCVCSSSDGSKVISGCDDSSVRIWELESGKLLKVWLPIDVEAT